MTVGNKDLPDAFNLADQAAGKAQQRFLVLNGVILATGTAAALAGALGLQGSHLRVAGIVATALFGAGLAGGAFLLIDRPQRRWYDARAGAESVKSLAFAFAAGGKPYPIGPAGESEASSRYRAAIAKVPSDLRNLPPLGPQGDALTAAIAAARAMSLESRKSMYLTDRVAVQRKWYATRSLKNDEAARKWRFGMLAGQMIGLAGGVLLALGVWDVDVLGIAAAATGAAVAWLRAREFEGLAEAYSVTERDLARVEADAELVDSEEEWAAFVADSESAISREHTVWRARRSGDVT